MLNIYISETDLIKVQLKKESTINLVKVIEHYILKHRPEKYKQGEEYYYGNTDVNNKRRYYLLDGAKVDDFTKVNNKAINNYHKLLVDQKVGYSVGNPIVFNADDDNLTKLLNDLLGEEFDDTITELYLNASNKGVEWLHPYINRKGEFKYVIIPAEEAIPIWDSKRQRELVAFIRFYYIEDIDGNKIKRVEYYTENDITYFIERGNSFIQEFLYDEYGKMTDIQEGHFRINNKEQGWGKVPFIPFKNNEKCVSDLTFYKSLIDIYDNNISTLADNLDEIQEVIYVLKEYPGTSLQEFIDNIRYYKSIKVDGGGGVDKLEINIPVEAKKELLDRLEKNIIIFGQGVNPESQNTGDKSGVALKFLYSLLDLKCSKTEKKFKKAIRELLWFVCEYLKISGSKSYDYKTVQITFNHSMIINEAEKIDMAAKSTGIVSDETIVSNHPWVEDVNDELERLKKQEDTQKEYDDLIPNNQDSVIDET